VANGSDRCPDCGSGDVARLVYGLPTREVRAKHEGESIVFSGCLCYGDERDPRWKCRACGLRFGQVIQLANAPGFWADDYL
jgi:hypothetical protein